MRNVEEIHWNLNFQAENISTLKNCVKTCPKFPLGTVCGKIERIVGDNCLDGGLRTKGIYKQDTVEFPLITYITVVRNRVSVLERCMQSVFGQEYSNIEYIVIDGSSSDGTLDLIRANSDKIDYFVSQPDSGIYEAMNKGVSLASGRLICMMNSDDICAPNAAQVIVDRYRSTGADLICGRVDTLKNREVDYSPITPRALIPYCAARYLDLNHQALYSSRKAFETVGAFDEGYTIVSDYKWELLCIEQGLKYDLIDDKLALFNTDGVSSTNLNKLDREFCMLVKEKFPFLSNRQVEIYYWGLTYGFAFRAFSPLFHKFRHLLEREKNFRITTYQTALHVCICDCWAIMRLVSGCDYARKSADEWLREKIYSKREDFPACPVTLGQINRSLRSMLEQSLEQKEAVGESMQDFQNLSNIKNICNSYYDKYRLSQDGSIRHKVIQALRIWLKFLITRNAVLTMLFMKYLRSKEYMRI